MLIQEFSGPNGKSVNRGGLPIPKGGAAITVQHPGALPINTATAARPGRRVGWRRGLNFERWPHIVTNNAPYTATTLEGASYGRRSLGEFAQDTADKIAEKLPPKEEVLPRVQRLLLELRANMDKIRMADRAATLMGVGGAMVGMGVGAAVGRWASAGNRTITVAGAGAAAAGFGLLTFALTRRVLMPPLGIKGFMAAVAGAMEEVAIEATGAAAAKAQATASY